VSGVANFIADGTVSFSLEEFIEMIFDIESRHANLSRAAKLRIASALWLLKDTIRAHVVNESIRYCGHKPLKEHLTNTISNIITTAIKRSKESEEG
jgi:hypothetical protein